ncbi:MAG: COX aromatic rich motif-containing protein [Acidiferrobacteraceae bacterium]
MSLGSAALMLSGCVLTHSFLRPDGPIAASEKHLFLYVVLMMLIVVGPVFICTPMVIWYYRRNNKRSDYRPRWAFSWVLEILIWGVPLLIVIMLGIRVWSKTQDLDPYRALASNEPTVQVRVVGLDWKWLFIYPRQGIAAVNVLAVPVGHPVHLKLTSNTVLLSLMIPHLVGQIYAMPGMTTQLNFEASRAGRYLGENTQYNGRGFVHQRFVTLALSPDRFSAWVSQVKARGGRLDKVSYAALAQRNVIKSPVYFSHVPAHLFHSIVHSYQDSPLRKSQDVMKNDMNGPAIHEH